VLVYKNLFLPLSYTVTYCVLSVFFLFFLFFFFTGIRSFWFNQCLHQNDSPYKSVFLHLLILIDIRLFSVQCNHLYFGLPASLLPSAFSRNTFLAVLSLDVLTLWPAQSGLLTLLLLWQCLVFVHTCIAWNSSLVRIIHPPFWNVSGPCIWQVLLLDSILVYFPTSLILNTSNKLRKFSILWV
jgi:hypothetical protein